MCYKSGPSLSLALLLHGNYLDDSLLFGVIACYLLGLFIYSEWKSARLKREKRQRKAERAAEARQQAARPADKTEISELD